MVGVIRKFIPKSNAPERNVIIGGKVLINWMEPNSIAGKAMHISRVVSYATRRRLPAPATMSTSRIAWE